jgi:hypothetical protein
MARRAWRDSDSAQRRRDDPTQEHGSARRYTVPTDALLLLVDATRWPAVRPFPGAAAPALQPRTRGARRQRGMQRHLLDDED